MTSKKGKQAANKWQILTVVLIGIAMAILGAVTSFAVTKSIAATGVATSNKIPNNEVSAVSQPAKNAITTTQTTTQTATQAVTQAKSKTPSVQTDVPVASSSPVTSISSSNAISNKMSDDTVSSNLNNESQVTDGLAKITHIRPRYSTVTTPYRTCKWVSRPILVHHHRAMHGSGVLLGGVTGGILGNQVGHGRGNIAATIGGTVLGAMAGNQMEMEMNRPEVHYVPVKVCTRHYEKKSIIRGYDVTYSYNGKEETTFMKKRPQSNYITLVLSPVVES